MGYLRKAHYLSISSSPCYAATFKTHLRQVLEVGSHRREIEQLHRALLVGNGQPGSTLLDSLGGVGVAAHLQVGGWWVGVKCADE